MYAIGGHKLVLIVKQAAMQTSSTTPDLLNKQQIIGGELTHNRNPKP